MPTSTRSARTIPRPGRGARPEAQPPGDRGHTATRLADGRVLVAGGSALDVDVAASTEVYDPVAGAWTPAGSMTAKRAGVGDGYVTSVEVFDPRARTWTVVGSIAQQRQGNTTTLLADGRVLVEGGSGGDLASAELFDPGTLP